MATPDSVSGLVFWLKADQISGLNDGDSVTTWEDQSGNSFDVSGSGATRPIYKTNIINSLPVVRFDGADFLSRGTSATLEVSTYSIFAVVGTTATIGRMVAYSAGSDSAVFGRGYALAAGSTTVNNIKGSGDGSEEQNPGTRTNGNPSYVHGHYDGTNMTVYDRSSLLDTVLPDTQNISYTNATGLFIGKLDNNGGGDFYTGDIGELFIYNNKVSDGDRAALQTYLSDKWFSVTDGTLRSPTAYIDDQGAGASGGSGGGAGGNIAAISSDGLYIYLAMFNSFGHPTVIRIVSALTNNGSVVFEPGAGGRIGVQTAKFNANHVWVAGEFDGTNTVEKSENAGGSFTVKDNGAFGTIRSFQIGPDSDNRIMLFDGDNGDIIESIDGGETWTTINAAVTSLINSIARYGVNVEELVAGNQGAASDSISYSPNSGVNLEDYQTGVYPNADSTKVVTN